MKPYKSIDSLAKGSTMPSESDAPALAQASCWNQSRLELRSWLQRNAPSLAELYEGAVLLLYATQVPGRVRFVSHAVREIRNRLPEVISGEKGLPPLQYKNRLDRLAEKWRNRGQPLELSSALPSDTPDVAIDRSLYIEILELIRGHQEARSKPEDAAFRLFESLAPENKQLRDTLRPIIRHWLDVTNWFMSKAHDSGRIDADHDENQLLNQFENFERALKALVGSFFSTVAELDEILEDANS